MHWMLLLALRLVWLAMWVQLPWVLLCQRRLRPLHLVLQRHPLLRRLRLPSQIQSVSLQVRAWIILSGTMVLWLECAFKRVLQVQRNVIIFSLQLVRSKVTSQVPESVRSCSQFKATLSTHTRPRNVQLKLHSVRIWHRMDLCLLLLSLIRSQFRFLWFLWRPFLFPIPLRVRDRLQFTAQHLNRFLVEQCRFLRPRSVWVLNFLDVYIELLYAVQSKHETFF